MRYLLLLLVFASCVKPQQEEAYRAYTKYNPNARSKISLLLLNDTLAGPQYTSDGAVLFLGNFSDTVGNEDSYKFVNPDENLSIDSLSIEGIPFPLSRREIPIQVWNLRNPYYYFKIVDDLPYPYKLQLFDNSLQTYTDVSNGTYIIKFVPDNTDNRFKFILE